MESLLSGLSRVKEKQKVNTDVMLRLIDAVDGYVETKLGEATTTDMMEGATTTAAAATTNTEGDRDRLTSTSTTNVSSGASVLDSVMSKLADQHKTYHASISRFVKAVDRTFNEGPLEVYRHSCSTTSSRKGGVLDEMVALHLYRQGKFRTAAKVVEEAGLSLNLQSYEALVDIHKVMEAMEERRDLRLACQWAEAHQEGLTRLDSNFSFQLACAHQEGLKRLGSNLSFQLARLQFLALLMRSKKEKGRGGGGGGRGEREEKESRPESDEEEEKEEKVDIGGERGKYEDAVEFAQKHLAPFMHDGVRDQVQALMGCLLYAGKLDHSPYAALLSPTLLSEAIHTLYTDGCHLLGLPTSSPLSLCYEAGLKAYVPLLKMKQVVVSTRGGGQAGEDAWDRLQELPGEIDLGDPLRFHSIFSCPVTRELASKENPPMMLKCGHVLCRNSMSRLTKGHNGRFKCPTCPQESFTDEVKQLHFW